jgi:hypothetical protein
LFTSAALGGIIVNSMFTAHEVFTSSRMACMGK